MRWRWQTTRVLASRNDYFASSGLTAIAHLKTFFRRISKKEVRTASCFITVQVKEINWWSMGSCISSVFFYSTQFVVFDICNRFVLFRCEVISDMFSLIVVNYHIAVLLILTVNGMSAEQVDDGYHRGKYSIEIFLTEYVTLRCLTFT